MRIYETFATEQATSGLTVAEAYDRRERKSRTVRSQGRATMTEGETTQPRQAPSWLQFAQAIVGSVERQLEDAELWTAEEVAVALTEVRRAAASLQQLEMRLLDPGG